VKLFVSLSLANMTTVSNFKVVSEERKMSVMCTKKKAKAVPLRAMKALGWRGDIAATRTLPRH
jgi:hypothetical protein